LATQTSGNGWLVGRMRVAGLTAARPALFDGAVRARLAADAATARRTVANGAGRVFGALDLAMAAGAGIDDTGGAGRAVRHRAACLAGPDGALAAGTAGRDATSSCAARSQIAGRVGSPAGQGAATPTGIDCTGIAIPAGLDGAAPAGTSLYPARGVAAAAVGLARPDAPGNRALGALTSRDACPHTIAIHIAG